MPRRPLEGKNTASFIDTPLANAARSALRGFSGGMNHSTLASHRARMIEVVHCVEKIRDLLHDPDLQGTDLTAKGERRVEGIWVIEAPRGYLIQHDRVDDGLGPAFAAAVEGMALPWVTVETDYQLTVDHCALIAAHDLVLHADAMLGLAAPYRLTPIYPVAPDHLGSRQVTPPPRGAGPGTAVVWPVAAGMGHGHRRPRVWRDQRGVERRRREQPCARCRAPG